MKRIINFALLCLLIMNAIMMQGSPFISDPGKKIGILFVHGLGGSHTRWDKPISTLTAMGNIYEGNYAVKDSWSLDFQSAGNYSTSNGYITNPLCLFTLDFSENQNLTFQDQGNEVNRVIQRILQDFTFIDKIVLVGHSMGGLAIRSYIMDYGSSHLAGMITICTPHLGSYLGYAKEMINKYIINPFDKQRLESIINATLTIDILKSKAPEYLKPASDQMKHLYSQVFPPTLPTSIIISRYAPTDNLHPFMKDILDYINSEGRRMDILRGQSVPLDLYSERLDVDLTDGVVTVASQDIKRAVKNGNELNPYYFHTDKFHLDATDDIQQFLNALQAILINTQNSAQNEEPKVNIGFILDSSGSMSSSDPHNIRKTGFIQLLDYIDRSDDLYLIDFDNSGRWLNQNNYSNWDKDNLIQQINSIDADGNTNIGSGLSELQRALESTRNTFEHTAVLLFTDGKGDYHNEADWYKQHQIPIYAISYKDFADGNLLGNIASETSGQYIKANDELDIVSSFYQFIMECKNDTWICKYSDIIHQGQELQVPFFIGPKLALGTIIFFLNWPGSSCDIQLKDPHGRIYNAGSIPGGILARNYISGKIQNPVPGKWNAIIRGVSLPPEGEKCTLNISSDRPKNFDISQGFANNNLVRYEIKDVTHYLADKRINANITLETPNHRIIDITRNFSGTTLSFVPNEGSGDYKIGFSLTMTDPIGTNEQIHFERSILVGGGNNSLQAGITSVIGGVAEAPLGKLYGIMPGTRCSIFMSGLNSRSIKANGVITSVTQEECQIEIQEYFGGYNHVQPGDFVEIDRFQWQNDGIR